MYMNFVDICIAKERKASRIKLRKKKTHKFMHYKSINTFICQSLYMTKVIHIKKNKYRSRKL